MHILPNNSNFKMVNSNDFGVEMKEEWEEWKTKQEKVVQELKETLNTETKKDVLFGGAIVASVVAAYAFLKDPCYLVALTLTGAVAFCLYKFLGK